MGSTNEARLAPTVSYCDSINFFCPRLIWEWEWSRCNGSTTRPTWWSWSVGRLWSWSFHRLVVLYIGRAASDTVLSSWMSGSTKSQPNQSGRGRLGELLCAIIFFFGKIHFYHVFLAFFTNCNYCNRLLLVLHAETAGQREGTLSILHKSSQGKDAYFWTVVLLQFLEIAQIFLKNKKRTLIAQHYLLLFLTTSTVLHIQSVAWVRSFFSLSIKMYSLPSVKHLKVQEKEKDFLTF